MALQTLSKVWVFCVRAAVKITKLECFNEIYHYTDYRLYYYLRLISFRGNVFFLALTEL